MNIPDGICRVLFRQRTAKSRNFLRNLPLQSSRRITDNENDSTNRIIDKRGKVIMSKRELKVVRLLEPELCMRCRFADIADVEMADGRVQRMLYCRRLDCDNWDYSSAEPAKRVEVSKDSEDCDDVA